MQAHTRFDVQGRGVPFAYLISNWRTTAADQDAALEAFRDRLIQAMG